MEQLQINVYVIIFFIKNFFANMYIYYSFNKIIGKRNFNNKKEIKAILKFIVLNILLTIFHTYLEFYHNSIICVILIYIFIVLYMSKATNNNIGYSTIVFSLSVAVSSSALFVSALVSFVPYKLIYKDNYYLNTICTMLMQFIFIYAFFSIKRFRNGFSILNNKFNNVITDVIVIFVAIIIMMVTVFMGDVYNFAQYVKYDIFILFIALAITMFIMIQRTLTTHYKQTQLLKTLKEYEEEIASKNKEIERLNNEKFNTSKIRHEFYNRQKALELLVKQTIGDTKVEFGEGTSENILKIIENLSNEYSKECDKVKQLPELRKTGILEIDSMFKYMQNECASNNINFKLRVIGEIYPLVNNIIPKDRLETLIGDHIRDSINAINNDGIENREILVLLGKKDKKYELSIHDTGIEFEIDTLLKLGTMRVTTCEAKGGTGIGFMTTFETLRQTGASLIITENKLSDKTYYTKSVTIRFDGKKQYVINSYRAKEIKQRNTRNDVVIKT